MARRGSARFWLLVAAVLAASAAFGIHPEPASAISEGALELSNGTSVESPVVPHDCLACRAHRPLVSAPAPFLLGSPERSAVRRALPRSVSPGSVVVPTCEGRAPPASV